MIDILRQAQLLGEIGKVLKRKIKVYAIGGNAMVFFGLKAATLDVDFVFENESDKEEFVNALRELKAKEYNSILVYGAKKNTPSMMELQDCRFDLFTDQVVISKFSATMKERAVESHEFGNLIVKVADPHDVIIMKSSTSREKDTEDIISIINKSRIRWETLASEAEEQIKLGNELAIAALGEKLEKINNQKQAKIPKEVLDKLWKLFEKQRKGKKRENTLDKG